MPEFNESQFRYKLRHKAYLFNLDKVEDKDLIEWLDEQENRSEAIREALREVRTS